MTSTIVRKRKLMVSDGRSSSAAVRKRASLRMMRGSLTPLAGLAAMFDRDRQEFDLSRASFRSQTRLDDWGQEPLVFAALA